MADQDEVVSTAERGLNLRLRVQCPECLTIGEVPTLWEGCNIRCRRCGIHFRAALVAEPLRAHDFKREVNHGATPRRVLLGEIHQGRKTRGSAA